MNSTYTTLPAADLGMLYSSEIFTIVFLCILGLLTTIFNGFTLYAIYKDPLRCFRTPLTTLITGIIISDLLTGVIVEPAVASIYAIGYIHHTITRRSYLNMVRITQILSLITMNSSFLTFLALAIAQFLAVCKPGTYERHITNATAKVAVGTIWFYAVIFALLPEFTRISLPAFFTLDLILNTTIVTVLLIVIYIVTYVVFKSKIRAMAGSAEQDSRQVRPEGQESLPKVEREFLKGTFLLTFILIITVLPFTIALYVWIYEKQKDFATTVRRYIAVIICENILFLKFLWDPAILILRIPIYRKSVVMVCSGIMGNNAGGVVAYNRHADEEIRDDFQETTVVEEPPIAAGQEVKS